MHTGKIKTRDSFSTSHGHAGIQPSLGKQSSITHNSVINSILVKTSTVTKGLLSSLKRNLCTNQVEGMSLIPLSLPALCSKREGSSLAGQEPWESPGEGMVGSENAKKTFSRPRVRPIRSLLRYWYLVSAKTQNHQKSKDAYFSLIIKEQQESYLHLIRLEKKAHKLFLEANALNQR